jgi:hypothetical protein
VLQPPADVRVVIEKLVAFVIKNGKEFEAKVREREASNPRFAFLQKEDMYHPFYKKLLKTERARLGLVDPGASLSPGPSSRTPDSSRRLV